MVFSQDSISAIQSAAQEVQAELSVWDLCLKGGFIMIPLAILLIVSIYIFIERYLVIRKAQSEDATFMQRIKDYICNGEIDSAKTCAAKTAHRMGV